MRLGTPDPAPRSEGDYKIWTSGGYGKPCGEIELDEAGTLRLQWLDEGDCDRLIAAATAIREQVAAYRAEMTVPHGRRYIYKGSCQLCGQPEDAGLHAQDGGQ